MGKLKKLGIVAGVLVAIAVLVPAIASMGGDESAEPVPVRTPEPAREPARTTDIADPAKSGFAFPSYSPTEPYTYETTKQTLSDAIVATEEFTETCGTLNAAIAKTNASSLSSELYDQILAVQVQRQQVLDENNPLLVEAYQEVDRTVSDLKLAGHDERAADIEGMIEELDRVVIKARAVCVDEVLEEYGTPAGTPGALEPESVKAPEEPAKTSEKIPADAPTELEEHLTESEICAAAYHKVLDVIEYGLANAETMDEMESIYRERGMRALINEAEIPCGDWYVSSLYNGVYDDDAQDRAEKLARLQLELDLVPDRILQIREALDNLNALHEDFLDECVSIRSSADYHDFVQRSQNPDLAPYYDAAEDLIWEMSTWDAIDKYPAVHIIIEDYDNTAAEVDLCKWDQEAKYDR